MIHFILDFGIWTLDLLPHIHIMMISEALETSFKKLTHSQCSDSPWLDTEVLLSFTVKKTRSWLLTHHNDQLNQETNKRFDHFIMRRVKGEPVAYIMGEKEFCGLSFKVNTHVLIPRPATEELVEIVSKEERTINNEQLSLVDIGTGCGCIAITLAKRFPAVKVIATDISRDALAVAEENATRHGAAGRITFLHGNLLEPLLCHPRPRIKCGAGSDRGSRNNKKINFSDCFLDSRMRGNDHGWLLITNLPYVPSPVIAEKPELAHEPVLALDGGPDGAAVYQQLFQQLINGLTDKLLPAPIALYLEGDNNIIPRLFALPETQKLSEWYTIERQNHVLSFQQKTLKGGDGNERE
ncbi:MAG: HemK/PrmC family methyltransferase [Patescibacteria group bacterium]